MEKSKPTSPSVSIESSSGSEKLSVEAMPKQGRGSQQNKTRTSRPLPAPTALRRGLFSLPPITNVASTSQLVPRGELSSLSSLRSNQSRVSTGTNREMGASSISGPPFGLMYPTPIWAFNTFLGNLSKGISTKELGKLKHSFVGIIGKRYLQKIETPEELFTKMRECSFLTENNILYLQALLKQLDRPELIQQTIDFASKPRNIMYMKPASDAPVNGYAYIKFHVVPDKEYTLAELQALQCIVAGILVCPPEYVLVAGLTPTSSVLVTLMVQVKYAKKMEIGLQRKEFQQVFLAMSIDEIITERTTHIIGPQEDPRDATEDQLLKMFERLTNENKRVQTLEDKCEQLEHACAQLREKCEQLERKEEAEKKHRLFGGLADWLCMSKKSRKIANSQS